ncbi:hypothetical protein [Prosthecobacter sp.]|uniref:hypothetical protein n=1 Tax=Prosthecobacter sp. TaxID=1965333 RepID=UPI001DC7ACE4|nr:hypothetical protein [Prosthecobacter sp.]MCB1278836.1 hypothetical protein [Prosthecobacter sp.]
MRRFAIIGLLVLVIVATSCVMLRTCWARMTGSIPSIGGKELHLRLPDGGKTHLQKDKRWAEDQLGSSTGTLGSHGCLVSSVAMACSNLGVKLTPKELNERLKKADGFLPQGWVVWNALPKVTEGRLAADYHPHSSHAVMDAALERGAYPVVKYFLLGGIQHWCVIVGKEGQEYLARDPLRDDKEPVKLSELTAKIYAVRVIRKVE